MAFTSGTQLGPYEILTFAGAGGMGEVYRARDARLNRDVAIKVLPVASARDPERMRRFQQEVQAVAALNHPNILAIHDFGEHEGSPYIVMEFLDGETVRVRLGAGALPMRKASEYAEQIARGLAAAHVKGIVHRDLKPDSERTDGAADNHHQLDVWPAELKQMKWKWVRSRRRPQLVRALLPVTTQAIQNYISLPIELLLHTAGSFASNGGIRREFAFRSDHGLVGSDPLISGLPTIRELSQECLDRAEQLTASQGQISHSI